MLSKQEWQKKVVRTKGTRSYRQPKTISDCAACIKACIAIENMQEDRWVDVANYVECQQIREGGDEDNTAPAVCIGAVCDNYGASITIGVFSDEECMVREDVLVEQVDGSLLPGFVNPVEDVIAMFPLVPCRINEELE